MARLDMFIVNVALPSIGRSFDLDSGGAAWVVLSYLLFLAGTLMAWGRLTDRLGTRFMFLAGYALFTGSSLLCGVAPTLPVLIAARCLQGAGSAMLLVTMFTMIPNYLPAQEQGRAFGLITSASGLGMIAGPLVGGWLASWSWRWVFLVNVPVGLAAFVISARAMPQEPRPAGGTFDLLGGLLSFGAVASLVYGVNQGAEMGWHSAATASCFALAAVLAALFWLCERRHPAPLLDLSLLAHPSFTAGMLIGGTGYLVMSGFSMVAPFHFEKHLDVRTTGLLLSAFPIAYLAVSPLAGRLSDRVSARGLCGGAMTVASLSLVLLDGLPLLLVLGACYGAFVAPCNRLVMSEAPAGEHGVVASLYTTVCQVGGVLGAAAFEAVFAEAGFERSLQFGAAVCALSAALTLVRQRSLRN